MKRSLIFLIITLMFCAALAPAALAEEDSAETTETTAATESAEETVPDEEADSEEAPTEADLTATHGTCGDNLSWTFENGTLVVSGKGEMDSSAPWGRFRDEIQKLVLTGGVTTVAEEAFKDCDALTQIDFGEALTEIKPQAFMDCASLESIRLPQTFRIFGSQCFQDCPELTEIYCSGPMPSFKANCLWNANTITIYTPMNYPWPQDAMDQLSSNFGGRVHFIPTGGDNLYNYHPTEPETEPATEPTTEPTTAPTTEATTAPTTEPTTVPTTESLPFTEPDPIPTAPIVTEPEQVSGGDLNSSSWIALVLIIGGLTLVVIGALIVRGNSRKGGRYKE